MKKKWMIYGANGYTGKLIVEQARQQGLRPILAGRNRQVIEAMAAETGFDSLVFDLEDTPAVHNALEGVSIVLHCAGPFSATSQPMIEACLKNNCHYLDITGEISVFANAEWRSDEARHADIVLMPGVGFDVVPTDCLAATLVRVLPAATSLTLAFEAGGGMSPGTAKTSIEGLAGGGCIRRDGKLKWVPLAWRTREIPFEHGKRLAVSIPWGDVFTAYISTGVPDIEVYMSAPPAAILRMKRLRMIKPLLSMHWVQNMMKRRIEKSVTGPGAGERQNTEMHLWGEVSSADGRCVSATMTTPDGYDVTVTASLGIVEYLLENDVEGGFYTPSLLMGADYGTKLPGVSINISP
ncbi:MAG: NAD(P)H-binding protein [Gammaproteobacteria bacterium]|nr:NAD(P)H-binding protein [Gammaproteobacteria bacterium]